MYQLERNVTIISKRDTDYCCLNLRAQNAIEEDNDMQTKKKILVVDDNEVNRILLGKILSDDYYVLNAENGMEALEILKSSQNQIEAVMLDIIMPIMDGYEFLKIVRKTPRFKTLPVIVMTETETEITEIHVLEMGATDFLYKPYRPQLVRQRLKNIFCQRDAMTLQNIVEHDLKSGLYNRDAFYQNAKRMILDNPDKTYNIICADVVRFKVINDLFGRESGNKLLKFIGEVLADCFEPPFGISGRLNADNFAACCQGGIGLEEKLMNRLVELLVSYPLDTKIIVKFGIYYGVEENIPISTACDRANLAIATIKGNYQQNCAVYNENQRNCILEEQAIVNDMHEALQNEQFKAFFQPKFNLEDGSIIGAEALVRWEHPTKGMLSPLKFITLFEKNGFIINVDMYIWEVVCKWLKKWIAEGNVPIPVSVNVSRVDIYNPDFCNIIEKMIEKYQIPKTLFELEITETAYTENPEQLIRVVEQLRNLGFSVQMDDFGTGYSSLNMLNDVPVDVLKLDMKFIQTALDSKRSRVILEFMIDMAKKMELGIIVEGIETEEQVCFLRTLGCCKGQGFYFARPMTVEEFEKKLLGA